MKKLTLIFFLLFGLISCKVLKKEDLTWRYAAGEYLDKVFLKNDSICYKFNGEFYKIIDSTGNLIQDSVKFIQNTNNEEFIFIDSLINKYYYSGNRYKVIYRLPINKNFRYGSEKFNKFDEIFIIFQHGWFRSALDNPYIVFSKREKNGKLKKVKYKLDSYDFYSISDCIPFSKDKLIIKYESLTEGNSNIIRIGLLDLKKLRRLRKYLKE